MSRITWLLVTVIGGGLIAAAVGNVLAFGVWFLAAVAHVGYIAAVGRERIAAEKKRGDEKRRAREEAERERAERERAKQARAAAARKEETVPVRERIIERQVVVTRCRYCNELTPVDLSACKSCGARL